MAASPLWATDREHLIESVSSDDHGARRLTQRPSTLEPKARELAGRLGLLRPLVFIDLETTGTDPLSDRIVEIGAIKLYPSGETELLHTRVNPGVPIPAGASAVHGITDELVAERPVFAETAPAVAEFLLDCDLAGFGVVRFDIPLLEAEFRRAGIEFSISHRWVVDALRIFHDRERRDLAAAVDFYTGREIEAAHSAIADAMSSVEVLWGQFERYANLPTELKELDRLSGQRRPDPSWLDPDGRLVWRDGRVLMNFGRYAGRALVDVRSEDPGYLEWVLQRDFSDEVKKAILNAPTEPPLGQAENSD